MTILESRLQSHPHVFIDAINGINEKLMDYQVVKNISLDGKTNYFIKGCTLEYKTVIGTGSSYWDAMINLKYHLDK